MLLGVQAGARAGLSVAPLLETVGRDAAS